MEWRASLPMMPPQTPLRLGLRFLGLALSTLVQYCLGRYTPPVDGWSLRTALSVQYLNLILENERMAARRMAVLSSKVANLGIGDRIADVSGPGFQGLWLGDAPDASRTDPILLYMHGGGYTTCDARTYLSGLAELRAALATTHGIDLRVLALEYTLAPEARFPTQIHEAQAAYEYLVTTFPSRHVFCLATRPAATSPWPFCKRCVPECMVATPLPSPAGAVLVSPWCNADVTALAPSYAKYKAVDVIHAHHLRLHVDAYLPTDAPASLLQDPLVSPIHGDFTGMCPMLLHYGGKEAFSDDCKRLEEILRRQNVPLTVEVEPLAPHITPVLGFFFNEMAARGVAAIAAFIAATASTT
ncbi:hypothetical protein SPRG_13601 [Saprolegnia parasitica CBS 223.65]|uniref:Alpha/beta hydrolase fold-3 domain-containing protein n=1 Tax=Saprolegnia parasitica (strain CBS 223.65) TaxID=695850 RepID=A0A067BUQ0_SAPPC|nr:hypothetical protein SPRG_13601 [Saprolegnia parasitica CBS 223.65]KDO20570.1 hypothetical protein SPRG_13601 [Saprolegnia parasitica CBS 223.65]|eukprot:XP_012208696.1 hypothetical protein SPRG_13601 [Saprolegnia parasitica CBS 223.65]